MDVVLCHVHEIHVCHFEGIAIWYMIRSVNFTGALFQENLQVSDKV